MTYSTPALAEYEAAVPEARHAHDRAKRRRKADVYRRDTKDLLTWTFPASRDAVAMTNVYPHRPDITRALCHRIYRDLQDAIAMPAFLRRRQVRIEVLRELFACECWLYRNQRASVNAQKLMGGFLNRLAAE